MKSRAVRFVLFLLVVVAFGGAAYNIAKLEQQHAAVGAAARAFDDELRQADLSLSELKAARFAYVAAGQGVAFWTEKSAALSSSLAARFKKLQLDATAENARSAITSAARALETSKQLDTTAQDYLRSEQQFLASDLVFGDLRQAQEAMTARLASARDEERAATDATLDAGRRMELATAGGAALFAVIVLLILLPAGRQHTPDGETTTGGEVRSRAISITVPPPATKAAPASAPASDLLPQTAQLCMDFARLKETSELPALLARLAGLLNAAGIIVWIADAASEELRPAAAHGYQANALAHIRAISNDADNATASAFRQVSLQVVEADGSGNGAIAVPLVTPEGCVGVMAAELRGGSERQNQTQALATIVAAQLATLVAPQDTPEA